jgi:hypothetical protein
LFHSAAVAFFDDDSEGWREGVVVGIDTDLDDGPSSTTVPPTTTTTIHPLMRAGAQMKGIDGEVGDALVAAGRAWSTNDDWSLVAESLGVASSALLSLSKKVAAAGGRNAASADDGVAQDQDDSVNNNSSSSSRRPPRLGPLWEAMAVELQDVSTIEGCSSIGPPSSLPNWIAIHDLLEKAVDDSAEEGQDGSSIVSKGKDEDDFAAIHSILKRTGEAINDLIDSII